MAAGDVFFYGPYSVGDSTTIISALSGAVVVADDITSHVSDKQVFYTVVKAA